MTKSIEFLNVQNAVKDSELVKFSHSPRNFTYKLNEKTARNKLIRGAKRDSFDIICKSNSCNLIYNLGSWSHVVLPSMVYWNESKALKTCKLKDDLVLRISDIKMGTEVTGKHVDTQVTFIFNDDEIKLHCYSTTQLILINGNGYKNLVQFFLKPFCEEKKN